MILTCPECATSYFVDESKIPPEGRMVKCASCAARWTAYPAAPEPDPAVELSEIAVEPAPLAEPSPEAEAKAEADDVSGLTAEDLPKAFRAKADTNRRVREAAAMGIVWAGMAAMVVVLLVVSVVFRVDVVRLWPRTAGAYASVGLPVNSLGLSIEGVKAEPSLQNGHAALAVSGMIRNIESRTIVTPPLRISLLDKNGKTVGAKIARAADPRIPPGETRHFALTMLDPPTTAHDLEVAFAPEAAGHAAPAQHAPKAAVAHEAPALRGAAEAEAPPAVDHGDPHAEATYGPEPVDAQPLPADSPYALEHHE